MSVLTYHPPKTINNISTYMQHMSSSWCYRCYPHHCYWFSSSPSSQQPVPPAATLLLAPGQVMGNHGRSHYKILPKKWMCLYEGQFQPLGVHQLFSKQVLLSWNWLTYAAQAYQSGINLHHFIRALHSTCWFRSSLEAPGCIMIYLDACSLESVSIWWMLAIVLAAIQFERVLIAPVCQPFTRARTFLDIENLNLVTAWSQSHDSKVCVLSKCSDGFEHWIREQTLIRRSSLAAMGMCQARGRNVYIHIHIHLHLHIDMFIHMFIHSIVIYLGQNVVALWHMTFSCSTKCPFMRVSDPLMLEV